MKGDRIQRRLEALLFVVRTPRPDPLTRGVHALALSWRDRRVDREQVRAIARRSLEDLEPAIGSGIRSAVRPGTSAAQVLAVARALWQLIDQPRDAEARVELAAIGCRLADDLLAGRMDEAAEQAGRVAGWCERHEPALLAAVRRLLDAP